MPTPISDIDFDRIVPTGTAFDAASIMVYPIPREARTLPKG